MDSALLRLPERLEEFRTALIEEIQESQRNKSNSVLLTSGRYVAKIGSDFHYEFETAFAVRVPPDTEGELTLEGQAHPVSVVVVAIAEPKITLSCERSLGRAIPKAQLKTDLTMLLRRLIGRIEQKAGGHWPAAERVMDGGPATGTPTDLKVLQGEANEGQRKAVESALGRDLTFIWGPPGTGKTSTIGWIGRELFKRGRSLLIVSHTNVAVDEALHKIAKECAGFSEGEIIRIGKPVKAELEAREDLVCECIAAKRKEALGKQKSALEAERVRDIAELSDLERQMDIVEWAVEAKDDIKSFRDRTNRLKELRSTAAAAQMAGAYAQTERPRWEARQREAVAAKLVSERHAAAVRQQSELVATHNKLETRILTLQKNSAIEFGRLDQSRAAEPLRQKRAALPSIATLVSNEHAALKLSERLADTLAVKNRETALARELLRKVEGMGKIRRLWHGLPSLEDQSAAVKLCEAESAAGQAGVVKAQQALQIANRLRSEANALDASLAALAAVPPLAEQERAFAASRRAEDAVLTEAAALTSKILEAQGVQKTCEEAFDRFRQDHQMTPDELLRKAEKFFETARELKMTMERSRAEAGRLEHELESELRRSLSILRELGLTEANQASPVEMMQAIDEAYAKAVELERTIPRKVLIKRGDNLRDRIELIGQELAAINEQIDRVMSDIILNARVIATTLTRAFMREVLQSRSFDTVLCDEASMAPMPALWAAATLATNSAVVVGDFLQLPPIVQSEHPLAKKWLGRDIFRANGLHDAWERKKAPGFFVQLQKQFRMHPDISDAPNALLYKHSLSNAPKVTAQNADDELLNWYRPEWGLDRPLLLVDTSSFGGWNNRSGNSRLNFLSASLCARLAASLLKADRPARAPTDGRRIFVLTPYRPHANLINLLLKEDGLAEEVQASTAHSCQGGEAEVVIIDLTVDQPHTSTTLTTKAANDDVSRLMNVAMTRAKRRLVIIGNFSWLKSKGSGAFVGGKLLPYLLAKHEAVPAFGVCARIRPPEPGSSIDGAKLAGELAALVGRARRSLTILSPTLSADALEKIKPDLEEFVRRSGDAAILTRPLHESKNATAPERARLGETIASLRGHGVAVIFKPAMHEKLVLADERLVWSAAVSPLGAVSAPGWIEVRGALERARELGFYGEIWDCLKMDLVRAAIRAQQLRCPICDSEMWLADASPKSEQPFYWKCVRQDCFTRSLKDPIVVDGLLRFECGGQPSFDYRGEVPVWVCSCGHHRKNIKPVHLRLPKMRDLVPKRSLNRVMRILGITDAALLRQGDLQF